MTAGEHDTLYIPAEAKRRAVRTLVLLIQEFFYWHVNSENRDRPWYCPSGLVVSQLWAWIQSHSSRHYFKGARRMVARKSRSSTMSSALLLSHVPASAWQDVSLSWTCFCSCTAPSIGQQVAWRHCVSTGSAAVWPFSLCIARHGQSAFNKWKFRMLLIVLPSSGQSHPFEAQTVAPGKRRGIGLPTSKTRKKLGAMQEWLAHFKGGRDQARSRASLGRVCPTAPFLLGLRKGKIPLLRLRGLGKSRVKPAQYQVLAIQKTPPNWAPGGLSKRTGFLPPPCLLPPAVSC